MDSGNTNRYEILPGLPPYGLPAVTFSATGQGKHREGFVVRFFPGSDQSWIGNFIGAFGGLRGVYDHPNGVHLIVCSGGECYVIDPESQQCLVSFGGEVIEVISVPRRRLLIVSNGVWLEALIPRADSGEHVASRGTECEALLLASLRFRAKRMSR